MPTANLMPTLMFGDARGYLRVFPLSGCSARIEFGWDGMSGGEDVVSTATPGELWARVESLAVFVLACVE